MSQNIIVCKTRKAIRYCRNSKVAHKVARLYKQKIVPNKISILIGMVILFLAGVGLGLTVFSLKRTSAAGTSCYWVAAAGNGWNAGQNWSNISGGAGGQCGGAGQNKIPGVAGFTDVDVFFTSAANFNMTLDVNVNSIASLTLQSGYNAIFSNTANNNNVTVTGNVTMDNARTDMGNGTWTVGGSFDNKDVTTFNRNLSTLVMTGTGKELISNGAAGKDLYNVTIATGATITQPATSGQVNILGGIFTVSGSYSISSGLSTLLSTASDVKVTSTGTITGAGTLNLYIQSKVTQQDGVIDVANLYIYGDHSALYPILPATYGSATVLVYNALAAAKTWVTSVGTYTFNGNVTFQGNSALAGTYTIDNTTGASFVFKGNVTITNGTSTLIWTKGAGTITAGGTTAQSLNFLGKTVEDLNITNTGGTVSLLTSAVTTDSLTVATNATFDLAGNNMLYGAAANTTNNGTIKLKGIETLTNVNNLDTDSGTVTYTGNNNINTLTLKDFNYFNLTITDANVTKATFQPTNASNLDIAGAFTLSSGTGTFDNATNDEAINVTGNVTMDNTRVDMGDAVWTVSGGFDNQSVSTFNRNLSTLVMNGTGNIISDVNIPLYNLTISSGANITAPASPAGAVYVYGQLLVSGTLSVFTPSQIFVDGSLSDIKVTVTGSITGTGEMYLEGQSKITQKDGTIDITDLYIMADHSGTFSILPATYESTNIYFLNNTAINRSWVTSAGTYTFNGNVTFQGNPSLAGTYTIDNSAGANLNFKGNVTITNGTSTLNWTKGTGTITAGGTTAQSLNFLGKTVEDLNITNTGGTVSLLTSAVTTDSLTVATNATFDLAGNNMLYGVAANTTNNGTIKLKGSETLTNVNNLDTDSGTVEYNGAGAGTYNLPEYGATDFNNLTLNSTAGTDTFRPPSSFGIGGNFTLTSGTLDNATNNASITIAGNTAIEAAPTWTKGTGTITFIKANGIQTANFLNKSVEDIIVGDGATTNTLQLTGNGVTTDQVDVNSNATLDLNGQNLSYPASVGTFNDGTIKLQGGETLTNVANLDTDSGWVEYNGIGSYGFLPYTGTYFNVNFSGSGSWTLPATLDVNGQFAQNGGTVVACTGVLNVGGNFNHASGTFTHNSGTVSLDGTSQQVSGSTIFNNFTKQTASSDTLTFQSGSTQTILGTLTFQGADTNLLSLRSTVDGSYWNIINTGDTESVNFVDVKDSNNTGPVIAAIDSVNSLHNVGWTFPVVITLSGHIYTDEGTTALDCSVPRAVAISVDGAAPVSTNCSNAPDNGSFSKNISTTADSVVTIFINGAAEKAVTVTKAIDENTNITANLYQNRLIVTHDNAGPITNANLGVYDGDNDPDIFYTANFNNLVLGDGAKLFIAGGKSYTPGGTVTTGSSGVASNPDGDIYISLGANFNIGTNALSLGGDYVNDGSFSYTAPQTTTLTATAAGHSLDSGASGWYNITTSGTGGWITSTDTLNVAGNLSLTAGTFDNATNDATVNVVGNVTMDNGTTSMGDNTWTVTGSFDNKDVTTFNRNGSTLVMNGASKTITSKEANDLNALTISGAISIPAASDRVDVMGALNITATKTLTIDGGETLYLDGASADLNNPATATITGAGTLTIGNDASIADQSGTIDVAVLSILGNHAAANPIAGGTYASATITAQNTDAAANQLVFSAGTTTINNNITFDNTNAGGTYTILNSTNNPDFNFKGNVAVNQTAGTLTWTPGTGTITFNGGGAQSADFQDKTVEDIRDSNVADTVTLTDGVTTDALTVDSGAKFDMAGQAFGLSAAGSPSNDGTIYMRGDEALTNVNDFDTNSGWVEYNGGGAYGSLPNYSYNNVNFNGAGSWTLGSNLTASGQLSVAGGTINSGASTIDLGDKFTQSGGVFNAPSTTMTVAGNFEHTAGTFTHSSGSIILDGADQTISGNTTFNNLTKNVAVARTLTFTQASTQTVSGNLDLKGVAGQLLSLRSSVDGTYWNLSHSGTAGTYDLNYLDVKDSNHTGGTDFIVFNSTNSGHNNGWGFPDHYNLTSSDTPINPGKAGALTLALKDSSGTTVNYTGNATVTFAGPSTSLGGWKPTINSAQVGNASTVAFTGGSASLPFVFYKPETASITASDSSGISTDTSLSITVNRPSGTINIEGQDNISYLTNPSVTLALTLSNVEATSSAQVKLSNDEVSLGDASYNTYSATTAYTLPTSNGRHRVFGMFKDAYGNTSSIAESNESAPLDVTAPTNPDSVVMRDATSYPQETGDAVAYGVLITWSPSTDSLSGVKGYVVSRGSTELTINSSTGLTEDIQEISGPSTSSGNKYFVDLESLEPNTSYTYSVKALDNAGNTSSQSSASLQLSKNNEKSGQSEGQNTITLSTTAPISEAEGRLTNIKNVKATPSATSSTIVWENNVPATCTVKYGTDTSYSNSAGTDTKSNGSTALTTGGKSSSAQSAKAYNSKCKIVLTDLSAETSYHFKVVSSDKDNVSVSSGDQTFTTLSQEEAQGLLELISARLSEFFGGVWRNIKNFFETIFTDKAQAAFLNHPNNTEANDPHQLPLIKGEGEGVNALSLRGVPIVLNTWTTWQSDVIVILSVAEGSHALTKGIPRLASLARDFASAQLYELYKPYKLYELFAATPALAADNASSITDNNYSLSKSNLASKGNTMVPKVSVFDSAIASLRRYLFGTTPAYAADASAITSLHISDVSSIDGSFLAKTIYWPEGQGAVSVTRDGTTLGQTEANFYLDTTIEKGKDYTYAVNSLSTSSAQKAVLPGGTPKITDLKAKATDVTQDSANIVVTWNTIGVPSSSSVTVDGCKGNSGKADESLNEFHTVVVTGVDPESTCKVTASGKSKDGGSSSSSITYTVPEAQKQKTILEIIVNALHNAFRGFARWIQT